MSDMAERLAAVQARIAEACGRVGRDTEEVQLLAAAKKRTPEEVDEAAGAGVMTVGENRVQEAREKIPLCSGRLEWHMIGHLQSNKVREAVRLFSMIHSVDSAKLLAAIDSACGATGKTMPVCLEVNVSGESSKFGLVPGDVPALLEMSSGLMNVDVVGLMTMPPFTPDPEGARPYFRKLREFRDKWRDATGMMLGDLSIGMSNDFEVAVEEGATWIRLGTLLFGDRDR